MATYEDTLSERFWQKVRRGAPDECWEWTAAKNENGYGVMNLPAPVKGNGIASRLSWRIHTGIDPGQMDVLHHCDNPPCVNPAHLFLGTAKDNVRDMMEKGRINVRRGEKANRAILREVDIPIIFDLFRQGVPGREIAKMFGVAASTIANLRNGYTWGWLTTEADRNIPVTPEMLKRRHASRKRKPGDPAWSKITIDQATEIRRLLAEGGLSQRAIGRQFGVTQSLISLINRKKAWAL